jgi:hypothetical protein
VEKDKHIIYSIPKYCSGFNIHLLLLGLELTRSPYNKLMVADYLVSFASCFNCLLLYNSETWPHSFGLDWGGELFQLINVNTNKPIIPAGTFQGNRSRVNERALSRIVLLY